MSKWSILAALFAVALSLSGTKLNLPADDAKPKPSANRAASAAESGSTEYIQKALAKPVNLTVMDASLEDVIKDLGKQADLPILIDERGLDSIGMVAGELNVSKNLKGLSLRSVLRNVLREFELTYMHYEGVLLITTRERAERQLVTAVYNVVDLVGKDGSRPENYDYDSLIELITVTVGPHTWNEVGGPGTISAFRGTIVVSQTIEMHEEITRLLAAARRAKKIAAEHQDKAPPVVSLRLSNTAGAEEDAAIEKALDTTAAFEFQDKPLADVVAALSKQFKIPIEINESALDAVGIGIETPITISVGNVKLRQAIRLVLRDLDLAFYATDGVLLITTPEDCEQNLITRAYPILDLVDIGPAAFGLPLDDQSSGYDYDSLIGLTTTAVAPVTWDEVGGPGSVAVMDAHGYFVISQTYHVHEQIEKLYTALRRTVPDKAKKVAKKEDEGRVRLAVYVVPSYRPKEAPAKDKDKDKADAKGEEKGKTLKQLGGGFDGVFGGGIGGGFGGGHAVLQGPLPDEEELLELITTLIEPESWHTRDDVLARAVTGRLVIRHTESVHRQIKELAARLAIPNFREIPKWQMQPSGLGGGFF